MNEAGGTVIAEYMSVAVDKIMESVAEMSADVEKLLMEMDSKLSSYSPDMSSEVMPDLKDSVNKELVTAVTSHLSDIFDTVAAAGSGGVNMALADIDMTSLSSEAMDAIEESIDSLVNDPDTSQDDGQYLMQALRSLKADAMIAQGKTGNN